MTCNSCVLTSGFTNIYADMENCQLAGTFTVNPSGYIRGDRCTAVTNATIDLGGTGSVTIANFSGLMVFINATDPGVTIALTGYYLVTIDSSCTAGTGLFAGIGILTDNSSMTVTEKTLPSTVWDEYLDVHTTAGTYGAELATKADIAASTSTDVSTIVSGTLVYGTEDSGDYTDTYTRDNTYWQIGESAGDGITVELLFNLPSVDHRPGIISVFGRYTI